MKKILFLLAVTVLLVACDDPPTARRALEAQNLEPLQVGGYSWLMCGKGDQFATRFTARNLAGKVVTGAVCSGWSKGATIRFD
jgi:hypothetical protein